ncbi:hypothetical protein [uncultured Desulfovibrio sp.]|uniref:hypothetical protein n=1 Tax=uncultured Desulfovibrio sp. TaxID=167968 RepID=UPI00266DC5B0|nr:hypothetical protein [uncultured Desulfovibrio sp.]
MSGTFDYNAAAFRAMTTLEDALRDMLEELPLQMARAGRSLEEARAALAAQEKQLRWLAEHTAQARADLAAQEGECHD